MIKVVLVPFDDSTPLQLHSVSWDEKYDTFQESIKQLIQQKDFLETPLLRPQQDVAGLYAYFNKSEEDAKEGRHRANIRASRIAMACGLLSLRFYGNVLLVRGFGGRWEDLSMEDIKGATCNSPDLRSSIQQKVAEDKNNCQIPQQRIPSWLACAAQQNYHDSAALAKVARAMDLGLKTITPRIRSDKEISDCDESISDEEIVQNQLSTAKEFTTEFVAKSSLCLHCRAMASSLCPDCEGAYFCTTPKQSCRNSGWSHFCLCSTWKVYTSRRLSLSTFPFFGKWRAELTGRQFQTQEKPYALFLQSLGIDDSCTSWWATETKGWAGGQSQSARKVDASLRKSYTEGFSPITDIPPERRISQADLDQAGLEKRNHVGLLVLSSWMNYYNLRGISRNSPVALLLTFPMTVYRAIERFGEVPITVARMLKRPLRIHVVGAEKELNFLDMFKEVIFLLPDDIKLELVFIIRQDMLPTYCQHGNGGSPSKFSMELKMDQQLTIYLVSGTYGDTLDPRFDCGTGVPDMLLALNAGLYAYESWRSVVAYLYENPGIVGVFSDYNEYSGVNCAAMGGEQSRNSLSINPFRQPLALPVYSMNLPQFSNGFIYVFNQQKLE